MRDDNKMEVEVLQTGSHFCTFYQLRWNSLFVWNTTKQNIILIWWKMWSLGANSDRASWSETARSSIGSRGGGWGL